MTVYARVVDKLDREPIEDLRIDFEDGYGPRPDDEEDAAATDAARALRRAVEAGTAPPFFGIRFKNLERPTRRRGVRTLDLFIGELARTGGLPGRVRGDAAEGDLGRSGRGDDGRVRRTRTRARPFGRRD